MRRGSYTRVEKSLSKYSGILITAALVGILILQSHSWKYAELESIPSISNEVKEALCYSPEGIIHTHLRRPNPNYKTCFGSYNDKSVTVAFHESAIMTPKIRDQCAGNPYHGFYDCLWPLLQYISACYTSDDYKKRYVLIDKSTMSPSKQSSWVSEAQNILLDQVTNPILRLDHGRIGKDEAVCFNDLVRFKRGQFWRPLFFSPILEAKNYTFSVPLPEPLKRKPLNLFRDVVLRSYHLSAQPRSPFSSDFRILVYDRADAPRRRWLNSEKFVAALKGLLEPDAHITFIRKMPASFEEQVALFNNVDLHITPHGGSVANSLFMKKNSAILEIQSRDCMARNETSELVFNDAEMKAHNETWTAWHAGFMDIHLMPAPCVRDFMEGDLFEVNLFADFVTDNPSLLKLTEMLRETQRISWKTMYRR